MVSEPTRGPFHVQELEEVGQALKAEEQRRPPDLIEEPLFASTSYTVSTVNLPRDNASLSDLATLLKQRFRLQVDRTPIKQMLSNQGAIEDIELLEFLLETDKPLGFINGMLHIDSPERNTPIIEVDITTETYAAAVIGSTIESSYVAQATAEVLWASAGAPQRWSDIEQMVQKVGYKTTSTFKLGVNVEDWFRPSFREFLAEHVVAPGSFGTRMGRREPDINTVSGDEIIVVADIHEIDMRVSQFNSVTGRAETCDVNFNVAARDQARHGIVTITTELPSPEHTEWVSALREALTQPE
jgi:hypothetical protein